MIASTTRMLPGIRRLLPLLALCLAPAQAQNALVVGATVSQTGAHADLAADYGRALELWRDQVNAAGGLLGRPVALRLLDDGSDAGRAGALYRQLIAEKAEVLVGPYGTAATLMAAAEAESAQRVLVNGAGWSRAVHSRKPRYVFQSAVPYSAYGKAALELAHRQGIRNVLILARDDPASAEMGAAALDAAARLGIVAGAVQTYPGTTVDFATWVARARAANAQAWIAFGEARDAADMVKSFRRLDFAPALVLIRGAADPKLIELLGQDAEYLVGELAYDARAPRPGNEAFAKAFRAKWSRAPGAAAAEGYAAATVLAEGLRGAGTSNAQKLRAALAALRTQSVLGDYRVDADTGEQLAAAPLLEQIVQGRREIVSPPTLASQKTVLPYAPWHERRRLK
jgi:branched-chain amino acid transport system substrate-binding protein